MNDLEQIRLVIEAYYADELKCLSIGDRIRKREVVTARHMYFYFADALTNSSLSSIAKHIGDYNHSTVIHGRNNIIALAQFDKTIARQKDEIEKLLTNL